MRSENVSYNTRDIFVKDIDCRNSAGSAEILLRATVFLPTNVTA